MNAWSSTMKTFVLAAAVMGSVACGDTAAPAMTQKAAKPSSGAAAEGAPLLAGFPADFPAYPHGDLVEAKVVTNNPKLPGVTEFFARWLTPDSGQQVLDFYNSVLNRGDWKIVTSYAVQADGSAGVEFTRKSDPDVYASVDYTKLARGGEIVVGVFVNPHLQRQRWHIEGVADTERC